MKVKLISTSFLIFLLLWSSSCLAWTGKVVSVTDGDTIKVLREGKQVKIRFHGIDTPEKKQAFGQKATQVTADMIAGQVVDIEETDLDKYGRIVGVIRFNGKNINEEIITSGYAWVYKRYCDQPYCTEWLRLEEHARINKLGLWQDKAPIPPWEWRKSKR